MKFYLILISITVLSTNISYGQIGSAPEPDYHIKNQLDEMDLNYEINEDGNFKIIRKYDNGRTQLGMISSKTNTFHNVEVREIVSQAYRNSKGNTIPKSIANKLLEDASSKIMGAWVRFEGTAVFVTRIDARASENTLLSALLITLKVADEMEEELSGDEDQF